MAELTTIGYRTGSSVPHQMDVRFKLVIMLSLSLVSATANLTALVWFTLIVIGGMRHVRLPFGKTIAELRYLLFLLLLICLVRIFLTPGSSLLTFGLVSLSKEGFYAGLTVSWRILLIVLWGLLFVATTRVSEIRAAVVWFLRPFPKIPNQKAATMISLILRFLPLIFQQAKETSAAVYARCLGSRKNPVYRTKKLIMPMIRRTFEQADQIVFAMEARCYTENRSEPELSSTCTDWITLAAMIFVCVVGLVL